MKATFYTLGVAAMLAACSQSPKTPEATAPVVDTAAILEQAALKAQQEQDSIERAAQMAAAADSRTSRVRNTSATESSETITSTSDNEAKKKKGWSKTAKGAVIGGVGGAAVGAAVNKKNRAVGAVVGGAIGAGTGAIIGNEMDKKDGRH